MGVTNVVSTINTLNKNKATFKTGGKGKENESESDKEKDLSIDKLFEKGISSGLLRKCLEVMI